MSELKTPRTPRPGHAIRHDNTSPPQNPSITREGSKSNDRLGSPVRDTGAMTPPPSTQVSKPPTKSAQTKPISRSEHSLASPPATLKINPPITSAGLFREIPSLESVHEMDEGRLRSLVTELLPAFGEARVSAAHSKLQHSLLSIETEEAAKRAAVEHEATRREVQVLQESSPMHLNSASPRSPVGPIQRHLQLALAHCRDLQQENAMLEKRLRSSKKIIAQLDEQNADLKENVHLLRQRIKENRDHLNEMQSTGAISINSTPIVEHSTPLHNRTPRTPASVSRSTHDTNPTIGSQNPFDALLLAGQVMNGEASSVPSSPRLFKSKKLHPHHVRGAHSLSSLPTTPQRSRPVTADHTIITPVHHPSYRAGFSAIDPQLASSHAQEDRESTISASDNDEPSHREEGQLGSQASQMATNMLRRSLGSQNGGNPASSPTSESSKLMQAKLFGQVAKPYIASTKSLKRGADSSPSNNVSKSNKKARVTEPGVEKIGLGIRAS